jgi:hypothetical protein
MRSCVTIGVAGAAALSMALSGSANAGRTVAVTHGILDEGPVLVGEGVAWSEVDCLTGCGEESAAGTTDWSVLLAGAGRRPAILSTRRLSYSGQGTPDSSGVRMLFDASPTRLVLLRISASSDEFFVFCATSSLRLYTPALPSGRRLAARPCSGPVDVAGTRVIYTAEAGHRSTLTAPGARDSGSCGSAMSGF